MSPSYNVMLQLGQIQCCLPFLNVKKIYLKLILQSHFCNLRLDLCHCDGNIKINYVIIRFDVTRVTHLGYVWSRLVIQCTTDRRKTIPYREMWAHWHQLLNHCRTRKHINPLPPKVVWMAVFPKSANKDTLPVYKIQFKSPWAAHLRIGISSYDKGSHFERNFFKSTKMNDFKHASTFYYIRHTPKL